MFPRLVCRNRRRLPLRPLALLRRRRAGTRPPHRVPPIPNCVSCRTGGLRRGHPRGADGRQGPGAGASLGRCCHIRRPPVARSGGHRHCGIPVPAVQRRGQAEGGKRPPPPLAPCRSHHRRGRTALRLPRECRPSSPPRLSRRRRRPGRHGLPPCGGPVHGGGSRRAPQARAAVRPCPPGRRPHGRPRAPALERGRVEATGRKSCAAGLPRWRATATSRAAGTARRPT